MTGANVTTPAQSKTFSSVFVTSIASTLSVSTSAVTIVSIKATSRRLLMEDYSLSQSQSPRRPYLQSVGVVVVYTVSTVNTMSDLVKALSSTATLTTALQTGGFNGATVQAASVTTLVLSSTPTTAPSKASLYLSSGSSRVDPNIFYTAILISATFFFNFLCVDHINVLLD